MTYDGEMKSRKWEKYVSCHVKYRIILKNLKEYGYQGLDLGRKGSHLLQGIKCDKTTTVIATVKANLERYENVFDNCCIPLSIC